MWKGEASYDEGKEASSGGHFARKSRTLRNDFLCNTTKNYYVGQWDGNTCIKACYLV